MEGKPHKLLESVAEDIAGLILQDYELVRGLKIKIKKPHVVVPGVVDYLGARINTPSLSTYSPRIELHAYDILLHVMICLLNHGNYRWLQGWRLKGFEQTWMRSLDNTGHLLSLTSEQD